MPEEQFEDGSIKVAMLTYSLSIDISLVFGFSWEPSGRGDVKKAIKRTEFLGKTRQYVVRVHRVTLSIDQRV